MTPDAIHCHICDAGPIALPDAIEACWTPSYWLDDDTETGRPICPECSAAYCCDHDNGAVLKPDVMLPDRCGDRI